jgi:hypothetical protein
MVHKPLRYSTLAAGLLKALGVQLQNTSRRMDTNSKMLVGKRLLVVLCLCNTMITLGCCPFMIS